MKYFTPAQWRAAPGGLPLDQLTDADLAGIILQAEASIDAWMGFRGDQSDQALGFLPGQREEREPWNPVQRRVYPACFPLPVQSVTTFEIVVSQQTGTGEYIAATVDPTMVVVNNDLGYLEPISLSVIEYGLTPVIAQLTVLQVFAHVIYQAGYQLAKTAWPLTHAADGAYHSFLPGWLTNPAPQVFVGGALQTSGYTVSNADGSVTFTGSVTGPVTASFTHVLPDVVTQATRLAAMAHAGEWFANTAGLAGFQSLSLAGQLSATRHPMRGGPRFGSADAPGWQALLAPMRRLQIAIG